MSSTRVIKVPDVGEGVAEVELVAWHVQPGDTVVDQHDCASSCDGFVCGKQIAQRRICRVERSTGEAHSMRKLGCHRAVEQQRVVGIGRGRDHEVGEGSRLDGWGDARKKSPPWLPSRTRADTLRRGGFARSVACQHDTRLRDLEPVSGGYRTRSVRRGSARIWIGLGARPTREPLRLPQFL